MHSESREAGAEKVMICHGDLKGVSCQPRFSEMKLMTHPEQLPRRVRKRCNKKHPQSSWKDHRLRFVSDHGLRERNRQFTSNRFVEMASS